MDNGVYDILYNTTTEIHLAGFLVLYSPLNIETVYKQIIIIIIKKTVNSDSWYICQ